GVPFRLIWLERFPIGWNHPIGNARTDGVGFTRAQPVRPIPAGQDVLYDRTMKLRFAAAALLAALPHSTMAADQTMEFSCPEPGTTFTYDSGTQVVARGRDGMDCVMEIVSGKPYRLRALLFDNPAPDGSDTSAFVDALRPERLWPLAVGKKIEADY